MQDIKNYFLIGDLQTAALVSHQGSIDWMCLPHFDSPSLFAHLLDKNGGCFALTGSVKIDEAGYMGENAVVEFILSHDNARVRMRDFMVPRPVEECGIHFLVRKLKAEKGDARVTFRFAPKPDYARRDGIFLEKIDGFYRAQINGHSLMLHLPHDAELQSADKEYRIEVPIPEGQIRELVLEYRTGKELGVDIDSYEDFTVKFWKDWMSGGTFFDFCRPQMTRSAVTLKLLQYYPTGALIAAPTTSLPEKLHGERNWDYRYVWVRDAAFTLYAFFILGFQDEAARFFQFIKRISRGCPQCSGEIHLMYSIAGGHVPKEKTLRHLSGYRNSVPVRIGNNAFGQLQLDIYGSLIDAYYFMWTRGMEISSDTREIMISLVESIQTNWRKADNSMWETRKKKKPYIYGKVMCWVGMDRAVRMCSAMDIDSLTKQRWEKTAGEIKAWIWKNGYNENLGSFVQYPGTRHQDATNFLFILLQFLDRHEERTRRIMDKTRRELELDRIFVYRYLSEDGLSGDEGAFVLCSYWLIAALAAVEDIQEGTTRFFEMKTYIGKPYLLAEETDPKTRDFLGNYPQSFSHMGLILAARYLKKYHDKTGKGDLEQE
jgi:GH15 family glucan-1,4-alpha-glucosidase